MLFSADVTGIGDDKVDKYGPDDEGGGGGCGGVDKDDRYEEPNGDE